MIAISYRFEDKFIKIETLGHVIDLAYSECIIGNPTDNETLIACHGFTSSRKPLTKTVLREIANDAEVNKKSIRILTFDWPGHGDSGRVDKYSFALLRGCLLRFMKALNISKTHLFGMSMGGVAGIIFTAIYPERVLTLTIQGAPIHAKDIKILAKALGTIGIAPALMLRRYVPNDMQFISGKMANKVIPLFSLLSPSGRLNDLRMLAKDKDVRREGVEDIRKFSLRAFYDFAYEFLTMDIRQELNIIKDYGMPVLILDGDAPEYVFIDTLPRLKEFMDGSSTRAAYIPGVGHMASILKPKEVAGLWISFIKEPHNT